MKILYYTNKDKINDTAIPELLARKQHSVYIHYEPITIDILESNEIDFIISDRAQFLILQDVIDYMEGRIINMHPSFLPWCKGYHPIVAALCSNACLGVTIHCIDKGIDSGDILLQQAIQVNDADTLQSLYKQHRLAMTQLLDKNLESILSQTIEPIKQNKFLGSIYYKKQFESLPESLPDSWDTKASWVSKKFHLAHE